jgi:precorrin-2/cobalt-factor-2 C20-methyltransferase
MNKLYAIGLGPGGPDLITVKAAQILKSVDIVIVPESNATGRSLAHNIVKKYTRQDHIETFYFPMINNPDLLYEKYTELSIKVIEYLKNNISVAYVTIGDLSIYSTFSYLWAKLKEASIQAEFIPGVPSFVASANIVKLPIVTKGESFCLIEMPDDCDKLKIYIEMFSTVIILKVYKKGDILKTFIENYYNLLSEALLVVKATLYDECTVDLLKEKVLNLEDVYLSTAILKKKKNG